MKNHHWATSLEGIIIQISTFSTMQNGEMKREFLFYKNQKCIFKGIGILLFIIKQKRWRILL